MKLKCVLSLTPLFLLVSPAAQAESVSAEIGTTGYYYHAQFETGVVLCTLTGSGTITATAGSGSGSDTASSTSGSVQAQASFPGYTSSSCTFDIPVSPYSYSVPLTSN